MISVSAFSAVRGFPNSVWHRFGSGCAYAHVDLNFSLTVLPLCGRCCASVLLCLRLIPEFKCLHSNVDCTKCLFLCERYDNCLTYPYTLHLSFRGSFLLSTVNVFKYQTPKKKEHPKFIFSPHHLSEGKSHFAKGGIFFPHH